MNFKEAREQGILSDLPEPTGKRLICADCHCYVGKKTGVGVSGLAYCISCARRLLKD